VLRSVYCFLGDFEAIFQNKSKLALLTFLASISVHAYDYTIKDKYGNSKGKIE
jgi:hypothetical protein